MNEQFKQAMDMATPEKFPDPRDSMMRPNSTTPKQQGDGNPLEGALQGESKHRSGNPEKRQEAMRKSQALGPLA